MDFYSLKIKWTTGTKFKKKIVIIGYNNIRWKIFALNNKKCSFFLNFVRELKKLLKKTAINVELYQSLSLTDSSDSYNVKHLTKAK